MAPPKKRIRKADYEAMSSQEESEDEWEQERQARASGLGSASASGSRGLPQEDQSDEYGSEEDEEDGVAQFESDEGEYVETDDDEVSNLGRGEVSSEMGRRLIATFGQTRRRLCRSVSRVVPGVCYSWRLNDVALPCRDRCCPVWDAPAGQEEARQDERQTRGRLGLGRGRRAGRLARGSQEEADQEGHEEARGRAGEQACVRPGLG